jgi:dGTP triphosphohydrolase
MATDPQVTTPVPDPTRLTTEQLERATANLDDKLKEAVSNLEDKLSKAMEFRSELTRLEFVATEQRFELVEAHRLEQKADTSKAVDAALQAAEKAVKEQTAASEKAIAKSESATSEAIKQLTATFTASIEGAMRGINDLKERILIIESLKRGGKDNTAAIIGTIAIAVVLVNLVLNLLEHVPK